MNLFVSDSIYRTFQIKFRVARFLVEDLVAGLRVPVIDALGALPEAHRRDLHPSGFGILDPWFQMLRTSRIRSNLLSDTSLARKRTLQRPYSMPMPKFLGES